MKEKNNIMTINRVFSVMQYLDRSDRRRFAKFMVSPFFNQSKPLTRLADFFLEQIELGNKEFDKQLAYSKISENPEFEDVLFRKYCSDLLGLVEDFFAHDTLSKDGIGKSLNLIKSLKLRKIDSAYLSTIKDLKKQNEQIFSKSSTFFFNEFEAEKYYYQLMEFDKKAVERLNVEEIFRNIDQFYFIQKLRFYCSILSQKNLLNQEYDLKFIDPIIEFLNTDTDYISPVVKIYLKTCLTLSESENETHYFELKNLIFQFSNLLEPDEALNIFDSAMNYCIKRVNQGKSIFNSEYFELVEKGLNDGILLDDSLLTHWRFNNIIAIALRLGKIEWCLNFVEKYQINLEDSQRENVVSFSLSRIYWYQKKYDKVLEVINNVEYKDFNYSLISKSTILKAYFELEETDALLSFLDSFNVYLNRHKEIPAQRKITYRTLINLTKKLTRLNQNDKKAVSKLKKEIQDTADFPSKSWLLEKLEELK